MKNPFGEDYKNIIKHPKLFNEYDGKEIILKKWHKVVITRTTNTLTKEQEFMYVCDVDGELYGINYTGKENPTKMSDIKLTCRWASKVSLVKISTYVYDHFTESELLCDLGGFKIEWVDKN